MPETSGVKAAKTIWRDFPEAREGDLSKMRASLVNAEQLAHKLLDALPAAASSAAQPCLSATARK